jgi:lipoprotein-releasing system permease protein
MLSVLAHIEVFDASGSMKDWQAVAKQTFQNPECWARRLTCRARP